MSRLSFFFKRLRRMDYKKMWAATGMISQRAKRGRFALLVDMLGCAVKYQAGYMDYMIAEMYRLTPAQRKTVITRGINNAIVRRMNDKEYWQHFDDKSVFNRVFSKWVDRDWISTEGGIAKHSLADFLRGKDAVFVKPLEGSSGQGVSKYLKADWEDIDAFHHLIGSLGDSIIEENVVQHPAMAAMNPSSVNTVRIATLVGEKQSGIVYAFLRIGNGKAVDNVDCGGMAARVDLATGRLLTVAADKAGHVFAKHPATGTDIIGFQLPFFEEAKQMCLDAMRVVPQLKYIAWDVALTEKGPRLIEGNSFPSHAVPQFAAHYPDGIGILPEFRKFIDL